MEIIALILFLAALLYSAIVIIEEKKAVRENARSCQLPPFRFSIPSWWKRTPEGEKKILFTSSDWQGIFHLLPPEEQSLEESLAQKIQGQQVVFDGDTIIRHPMATNQSLRMARIEGTATEKGETRLYVDAFLAECQETQQRLYGESKSPVLSGSREGPWFEECLNNCYSIPLGEKPEGRNNGFS